MISEVDFIAEQLRAASPGVDWNLAGHDRSRELAAMFRRAGFLDLSKLSVEAVPIWECFKMVGFANDPKSQAEYDALKPPVFTTGHRAFLQSVTGWFTSSGAGSWRKKDPMEMLQTRGYFPLRFRNGATGAVYGFLGDTNNDATISNEAALFKWLSDQQIPLIGWSARGDGNVSYVIAPGENGFNIRPFWASSSAGDKAFVTQVARDAVMIGSIAFAFAGAGSLAANLGEQVMGSTFAAANPVATKVIGSTLLNTAMNGGDVEEAFKRGVVSVGAETAGVNVGGKVQAVTGLDAAGRVASAVTTAYIRGGDVDKAATFALVQSVPDFFPSENQQMDWLSISSGNVGEPDVWGISALPGVVSPESSLPGFSVSSLPSLADTFTAVSEAGQDASFWDQTKNWFSTTFTKENVKAAQDLTTGVVGIVKTVRSLDPNAPQPRAAAQQTQTIRNPDGGITRVSPDGTVQVITPEQLRQMQGGGGFNLSPQMLAIGGAALVALVLLSRRR